MMADNPFQKTDTLDDILLDVATLIELSPRDRRIAENRYRILKEHLEREKSPLARYLVDGASLIYAQGSVATSTTIISGTEDDRFDVDAIVEIDVPSDWDNKRALDTLFDALQGFPGASKITRCTRCVQIQFPFMHMDVTIMDRRERLAVERAGEIFHSPDEGASSRVPSNPWGFTAWFRAKIGLGQRIFVESLGLRRATNSVNRLQTLDDVELAISMQAEQVDLPPMIPSAIDAQEAVALKLLKRFLNLRYENTATKRPPSIYLTKRAGDVGLIPHGLTVQLYFLAHTTAEIMRKHIAEGARPQEANPSYSPDLINDRWPRSGAPGVTDMRMLAEHLEYLTERLEAAATLPLAEISEAIDDLFGERIGREQRKVLAGRYDRRKDPSSILIAPRTGAIVAPSIAVAPERYREVPRHNFHPMILTNDDDE